MAENTWETNEFGTRTFRHGGWTITIFPSWPNDPQVEGPPFVDVEVKLYSEGVEILGEDRGGFAVPSMIPWRILQELCALNASGVVG